MRVPSLGLEDPLEEDMTTHSSIFAFEIPWTEEPGGLQFRMLQSQTGLTMHTLYIGKNITEDYIPIFDPAAPLCNLL